MHGRLYHKETLEWCGILLGSSSNKDSVKNKETLECCSSNKDYASASGSNTTLNKHSASGWNIKDSASSSNKTCNKT